MKVVVPYLEVFVFSGHAYGDELISFEAIMTF